MAFVFQGQNPASRSLSWSDAANPVAQALGTKLGQNKREQENLAQGSILKTVFDEIAQKGDNATLADIQAALAGAQSKGLYPQTAQAIGQQYADYIPKQQTARAKEELQAHKSELEGLKAEKALEPYKKSLSLIERAKELQKSGHLGPVYSSLGTSRKFGSTASSEGQQIRSEYKSIGRALVQAAAPLKITNRSEFQHYAQDLEDETRTNEEILGTLAALERIVRESLPEGYGEEGDQLGRTQNVKPGGDIIKAKHRKTGEEFHIPKGEFREHPDLEVMNQ